MEFVSSVELLDVPLSNQYEVKSDATICCIHRNKAGPKRPERPWKIAEFFHWLRKKTLKTSNQNQEAQYFKNTISLTVYNNSRGGILRLAIKLHMAMNSLL